MFQKNRKKTDKQERKKKSKKNLKKKQAKQKLRNAKWNYSKNEMKERRKTFLSDTIANILHIIEGNKENKTQKVNKIK